MKNRVRLLLITIMVLVGVNLTGCGNDENRGFKEKDKLSVVTTIYPMYDFTKNIAGDKAEIINLVPAGMEPHDFELSAGDMQLVEEADVFIYNGAGMEHFAEKTLDAVSNKNLYVVECTDGIELLDVEGHTDPHTWLGVENAIKEAEVIKNALIEADDANKEYYEENYKIYKSKLEELQELYETELKDLSSRTIVVAHEAFGYLCDEYDLEQEAIEGLTADSEPDSARMKEIIDFCRDKGVKVIFFEELVSPKVANTIASEIGAATMILNPIEGLTSEQEVQGYDYIGLMKENLETLKSALK